jgi:hypothetical protein
MTLYDSANTNHEEVIKIIRTDSTILQHVPERNIFDHDWTLIPKNQHPAIAIPPPLLTPEPGSIGLITYSLTYNIKILTDTLDTSRCRKQMNKIAYRLIDLLEARENIDVLDSCTYSNILGFDPNFAVGGTDKNVQMVGELTYATNHEIARG